MIETAAPALLPFDPAACDVDLMIFDLDGVLVDVQHAENAALAHLAERMGLHLSVSEYTDMFSGRRMQECIDLIEQQVESSAPADAVPFVRETCARLIGPTLEPIDGVREALAGIAVTKCVASNSPSEIIRHRLMAAGIDAYFGERTYSAYDINAWKPDPSLFLWAAADLGVDPGRAVVVEDSAVGITAARAAGMRVLQFCGPGAAQDASATQAFSTMSTLPALIGMTA